MDCSAPSTGSTMAQPCARRTPARLGPASRSWPSGPRSSSGRSGHLTPYRCARRLPGAPVHVGAAPPRGAGRARRRAATLTDIELRDIELRDIRAGRGARRVPPASSGNRGAVMGEPAAPGAALVRAEVEAFGGTVEQTVGGRTVAVFGVPRTRADDPEHAVRAALAIRDALAGPGPDATDGPDGGTRPAVRLHVAVATGEALVRPGVAAGGHQRVLGDPVTVGVRMLEIQREGAVLVTEATGRATERTVSYAPAGAVALGGGQPVAVWSALGLRADAEDQVGQGPVHPLVARTRELGLLLDRFAAACRTGRPHLVTLVGPPGIGKSRLVAELAGRVRAGPPATWRQGRSLPYGHGVTFWTLSMIVKAETGILETDTAAQAERKLARAAAAILPGPDIATWVAGKLRRLVGASAPAGPASGDQEEAFAAWRRFLYGLARRRPLVLVAEDLHWADDALLDFLERLVAPQGPAEAGPVPLLVVATARPELLERRPGWAGGHEGAAGGSGVVTLGPLSDRDTSRLLAALLARHGLPGTGQ